MVRLLISDIFESYWNHWNNGVITEIFMYRVRELLNILVFHSRWSIIWLYLLSRWIISSIKIRQLRSILVYTRCSKKKLKRSCHLKHLNNFLTTGRRWLIFLQQPDKTLTVMWYNFQPNRTMKSARFCTSCEKFIAKR